jgi:MFS transporter, ACS family, hexuronate transporter
MGTMIFVIWWSVANMLTAAARGMTSLGTYRFMLGLGEAGIWPAASKAVSEWFPAKQRAFAIGLYTMGATIGATVAPYLVIPLATYAYADKLPTIASWLGQGTGWRLAFIITGFAGLLFIVPWLLIYRKPQKSKFITKEELDFIEQDVEKIEIGTVVKEQTWSWKKVLTFKGTWLLLLARLLTDPVWYFFQFWFPKYLSSERNLSQNDLKITWVIYAAAGVGSLFGGWLSGRLIKNGSLPVKSRMKVMLICACILPLSPLISMVTGLNMSLVVSCAVVLASLAWLINLSAIIVDIVPSHSLGTVFSIVAAGSTIGGIIMNMIVVAMVSGPSTKASGFLDQGLKTVLSPILNAVQGTGYASWFLIIAFLHPIGWLLLKFGGINKLQPTLKKEITSH